MSVIIPDILNFVFGIILVVVANLVTPGASSEIFGFILRAKPITVNG